MAGIPKAIVDLAEACARDVCRSESANLDGVPPTTIEVLETCEDATSGYTRAWIVFDFMILHMAQSGSDSYDHFVYAGTVTLRGSEVISSETSCVERVALSEHEVDWAPADRRYDRRRARERVRDAWWASELAAGRFTLRNS